MCHHYRGVRTPPEHLANEFSTRTNLRQLLLPEASYYPLKHVPVIRLEDGERELVEMEWGLLPLWWKPSAKSAKRASFQRQCFNAKSETADAKPAFRDAFKRRRCLLPAVEFFEKDHYFSFTEKRPFAFAGLWERWKGDDGDVLSCTLLTTEPNAEVKGVGHHRMPVLLEKQTEWARWIDLEVTERGALEDLMRPKKDGVLQVAPAK